TPRLRHLQVVLQCRRGVEGELQLRHGAALLGGHESDVLTFEFGEAVLFLMQAPVELVELGLEEALRLLGPLALAAQGLLNERVDYRAGNAQGEVAIAVLETEQVDCARLALVLAAAG